MALSVTRARVKERCGESGTAFDTAIDHLIEDHLSAIEYAIRPDWLDSSEAGVQATLNLGALEIVTGEFMALRFRQPGAGDYVRDGEQETFPYRGSDPADPFGQVRVGWRRLRPFLRHDLRVSEAGSVLAGGGRAGVEEEI